MTYEIKIYKLCRILVVSLIACCGSCSSHHAIRGGKYDISIPAQYRAEENQFSSEREKDINVKIPEEEIETLFKRSGLSYYSTSSGVNNNIIIVNIKPINGSEGLSDIQVYIDNYFSKNKSLNKDVTETKSPYVFLQYPAMKNSYLVVGKDTRSFDHREFIKSQPLATCEKPNRENNFKGQCERSLKIDGFSVRYYTSDQNLNVMFLIDRFFTQKVRSWKMVK